jgi:hypothetical protein
MQSCLAEQARKTEQEETELSAAMEEVKQRSANHARLSAMADLTKNWGSLYEELGRSSQRTDEEEGEEEKKKK